MSIVLGINAYHADSSACVVINGKLVAAAEEERFRRIKHWAGFPSEAIRFCLGEARATLADVSHIAVNSDPKAHLLHKAAYAVRKRPELSLIVDRLRNATNRHSIEKELDGAFGDTFHGRVHRVEHHLSHLASAYYAGPFEDACVVSVDGFGDFSSAAWGVASDGEIQVDGRVLFPHSLGVFYQAMTQYLGFPNYGDEYKVMGLAPYGQPTYLDKLEQVVLLKPDGGFELNLQYFRHHTERVPYVWSSGSPEVGRLYTDALADLLGPVRGKNEPLEQKHRDMARSIQAMYEKAFFHLLESLHRKHKLRSLCVAGGCGMNSVANGKVRLRSPFKDVYIQSAAGDAGGAIGAALMVAAKQGENLRLGQMPHAYLGPAYSDDEVQAAIAESQTELDEANCTVEHIGSEATLCERTAEAIGQGKVIGWFQGRMEWGPRALGNRSILGDPRRADMKDILNLKIKRRESFRPFAPSVLREAVNEWFEQDDEVPFMMKVFQIREDRREQIPAVTHVDGSGRLQTVTAELNARYHHLISAFARQTGVPMLLNTSFNENEPVVCRPQEALACFLRTNMDVLVLGDRFICRPDGQ